MKNKNNSHAQHLHRGLLASAVFAGMGVGAVQAIEIDVGNDDYSVRFDNTFKYNYGVRTESADDRILATPNSNDGNFNFRRSGTNITNRVDILSEFDVVYKESMGFRVSAAGWYDRAYENVGSNSNPFVNGTPPGFTSQLVGAPNPPQVNPFISTYGATNPSSNLSNRAQRYYTGPSGEILDAFVFYSTEVGDESLLSFKIGRSNAFWGETLLNPVHSMSYGQSGLDLAKLASSPGIEAKELFVPRNQIFTSITLNREWTFAGQYFLDWDAARLPEAGTYYGFSDVLGEGAQSFVLGHSSLGVLPPGQLTIVPRGSDLNPDDRGDWGVQARWSPEWLDGTLGFYYRETADILPQTFLSAPDVTAGDAYIDFTAPDSACGDLAPVDDFGGLAGCANAQLGGNLVNSLAQAKYGLAYAEDIEIYGISVSKNIGGVSIGSDLNYRRNMPLSSIAAIFSPNLAADINSVVYGNFGAGYEPVSLVTALPARSPGTGVVSDATANNSTFATGDTLHFTVNALATFADTPVFDSAVLIAEVGYSNLLSLDSKNSALYKGRSTYRGIDASDRDNLVFTTAFTPTWYEVLPGIDMTAPLALSVGVYGNSPVQAGGNEGAGNYSLGVGALIYNKYFVDLKYVDAFGRRDNCNASPASTVAGAPAAGDGSTPNALGVNEGYTCYEGSVSSFSGPGAAIQDRGAVYLTLKTTI